MRKIYTLEDRDIDIDDDSICLSIEYSLKRLKREAKEDGLSGFIYEWDEIKQNGRDMMLNPEFICFVKSEETK